MWQDTVFTNINMFDQIQSRGQCETDATLKDEPRPSLDRWSGDVKQYQVVAAGI